VPTGLEPGIDELEHGALIGEREPLDALQALQQPRGLGRKRVPHRLHAEQDVGGDLEREREGDEQGTGWLRAPALVVGDHAARNALRPSLLPGRVRSADGGRRWLHSDVRHSESCHTAHCARPHVRQAAVRGHAHRP